MTNTASPRWLLKHRSRPKPDTTEARFSAAQKAYVAAYLRAHRRQFYLLVCLMMAGIMLEISLPIMAHLWQDQLLLALDPVVFLRILPVAVLIAGGFLWLTFKAIKLEKSISLNFITTLRRAWVESRLRLQQPEFRTEERGRLLAKLNYHLPLLEMGLQFALFGAVRWMLLMTGLVITTFFIDPVLLAIVLLSIPGMLLFVAVGHLVSRRYVSREQTLSSRIIAHVESSASEFAFFQRTRSDEEALAVLDELTALDTHFRIRRTLWMRFGNVIGFITIAFVAILWATFQLIYPLPFLANNDLYIVYGTVLGLLVKLLYDSIRIGMFAFPLQLGLRLCVPFHEKTEEQSPVSARSALIFSAGQVRLARGTPFLRRLSFSLQTGERILITAPAGMGRTTLARTFAGIETIGHARPWHVIVDARRLSYEAWQKRRSDVLYVDPLLSTELTALQLLTGRFDQRRSGGEELRRILDIVDQAPHLGFLTTHAKGLAQPLGTQNLSFIERGLVQLAAALVQSPGLLIIDHVWLDMQDERFMALLRHVAKTLTNTTIVCFASKTNNLLSYDQTLSF